MAKSKSPYTGRFIVRLTDSIAARLADRARSLALADLETLQEVAGAVDGLDGLKDLFSRYPPHPTSRGVAGVSNAEILQREERAARSSFPPIHSLLAYFIVDPRPWKDRALSRRYLADLRHTPEVGLVYEESRLRAPRWAVDPSDPLVKDQGYLNAAPQGVGANTAEVWGSFDGRGVGFADVESGWNLKHRELPPASGGSQPLVNDNDEIEADHGTAVLGIVLAQQDGVGITGLAPAVKFIGVASWFIDEEEADPDIPGAILAAALRLKDGDVLLIEVETELGFPVEVEDFTFAQIRNAAGNDIIVIEPAGNGTGSDARDLDKPPSGRTAPGSRSLNRNHASFLDSGAILVSACRSSLTPSQLHRRKRYAGFGSRVDCYAWGENVATAGGSGLGPSGGKNGSYTDAFDGTSAASAIIAGVAILVQDMAKRKHGQHLPPLRMRTVLSTRSNGTGVLGPSKNTVIGVMPDLKVISGNL